MSLRSRIARRSTDLRHPPTVAMLVRLYAHRYRRAIRKARRTPDARSLYAVRNAIRRALALLSLAAVLRPHRSHARLARALERPFRACGAVRDLELVRRHLGTAAPTQPVIRPLLEELRARARRKRERAVRALAHTHARRAARLLTRAMEGLARPLRTPGGAARLRARIGARLAAAAAATAAAKARAANGAPRRVHLARLALKDERYLVELAGALGVAAPQGRLARLAAEQDALGAITDNAVLQGELDRYRRRHPRAAAGLGALRRASVRDGLALAAAYRTRPTPSVAS
jgi:CHAD domain-containing protein